MLVLSRNLFLGALLFSSPLLARDLSFEDLTGFVGSQNLSVKASEFDLSSERALEGQLKRAFIPSLGLTGGFEEYQLKGTPSSTQSSAYGFVHSELNLYNRGLDRQTDDLQNQKISSRTIDHRRQSSFETLRAQELYWQVVGLNLKMNVQKDFQRTLASIWEKSKKLVANRVATKSDDLLIQIALRKNAMEFKEIQLELDEAKNQLALTLGLDEHKDLNLVSSFPKDFSPSAVVPANYEEGNEVLAVESQRKMIEIRQREFSNWWHPSVNLYGQYGVPSPSEELEISRDDLRELVVGVRFDFSFGQAAQLKSVNESYQFQNAALEARVAHTKRLLAGVDHELRHDISLLAKLINEGQEMFSLISQRQRLLIEEFERGVAKPSDLLAVAQENYESKKTEIEYKVDYLQKTAKLHYLNQR